jgi:hypothetical protein
MTSLGDMANGRWPKRRNRPDPSTSERQAFVEAILDDLDWHRTTSGIRSMENRQDGFDSIAAGMIASILRIASEQQGCNPLQALQRAAMRHCGSFGGADLHEASESMKTVLERSSWGDEATTGGFVDGS